MPAKTAKGPASSASSRASRARPAPRQVAATVPAAPVPAPPPPAKQRLVVEAPPVVSAPAWRPVDPASFGQNAGLMVAAIVGGLAGPWFFSLGYGAIDQARPAIALAVPFYALVAAMAGALAVGLALRHGTAGLWAAIAGGVPGVAAGLQFAFALESSYDELGGLAVLLAMLYGLLGTTLLAGAAAGLGAAVRGAHGAWLGGLGAAMAWLAAWGTAALYHLATIQHQADLARAAHASPPAGLLLVLVALGLAAAVRRRRDAA